MKRRFHNFGFFLLARFLCCVLVVSLAMIDFERVLTGSPFKLAEAAEVTIDAAVTGSADENSYAGLQNVFISDQVGYKFYVDGDGRCKYRKTTDGGDSWPTVVTVDTQTDCFGINVWYDKWTPGDSGEHIHIVTMDPGNDDLWYNRLDTADDTRLLGDSPVSTIVNSAQTPTIGTGANRSSISKSTNGTVYMSVADGNDSFVVECTASCNLEASWVETGVNPMDNSNDYSILQPLSDGDMLLIYRDVSLEDILSKEWDDSTGSWDASWLTIDISAFDNATYEPGMAAVTNPDTGDTFLAYIDNASGGTAGIAAGGDDDIRTARYDGSSWTLGADVKTDTSGGITDVSISIDANTEEVYIAYTERSVPGTLTTADVFWATSTPALASWGAEQGPVNTTSGNLYGVALNGYSDERMYVTWTDIAPDDSFGDTLADLAPFTVVAATGTMQSVVRASSSEVYVGGAFVISENVATRTLSSITLTESGTIDASVGIDNIDLVYDLDTSAPYDCASESYGGAESQFGITDTGGFSGADGTAEFSDIVSIGPSQTVCGYVVLDVLKAADDGSTLAIEIANPATDVMVSGGVTPIPPGTVALGGATVIEDSDLTQTHFHWRDDVGNESGAGSRTGGVQDISLSALQQETPARLRLGVSNDGSTTSLPTTLRLEFAPTTGACDVTTGWTDVGATDDDWNMFDSTFISDGGDSTDIGLGIGGVDNENTVFLTPNGGLRDTSSTLGSLSFLPANWTEVEFSVVASSTATEGNTYCFRVTDAGTALSSYDVFPRVTISADVTVAAIGSQVVSTDIPTADLYLGGAFSIVENSSSRNVTNIRLKEQGSVDATAGVSDIRLFYESDASDPYDCVSESYDGTELQFGTASSSFSAANGYADFVDNVSIATTSSLCVYPVVDVTAAAQNSDTVDVLIEQPSIDVLVTGGGTVAPSAPVALTGSTTLQGSILTQAHYHWRSDNGTEITASSSAGFQDTALTEFSPNTAARLRLGISNEGATTSVATRYQLEYGIKISTCDAIVVWTDLDASPDGWDMSDSPNLTNGDSTTDIATTTGGVDNPPGKTFLSSNGGVRDTESLTGNITLTENQFTELEYSITSTATTSPDTTYCFRATAEGVDLPAYDQYAEITTAPKRDFKVQRGTTIVTGTGVTLTAGSEYTAPSASSTAFVRITNAHYVGAGRTTTGNTQNANDVTAYISDPENIESSFTISRVNGPVNDTRVSWEIVEFVGDSGTDNEMIVRSHDTISITGSNQTATGTAVATVLDDSQVVVFITGIANSNTGSANYPDGQVTSKWNAATNQPVFERIASGSQVDISYAVVEYTGLNWNVQRVEHLYESATSTGVESITAVNSINKTFLHTQKRVGELSQQTNFGHRVWISSIGAVSFELSDNATTTEDHISVAWVIENTQTSSGAMNVYQVSGFIVGGTEPRTTIVDIGGELNSLSNASIFAMTAFDQDSNNYPRVLGGFTILDTENFEIWNSDRTGSVNYYYNAEVLEWPTANLAFRQNYYRFYTDSDTITPTDPWPIGLVDLGENTAITALDEPLAEGERIRIRMSVRVSNASLPAGLQSFKLQYGLRAETCSGAEVWTDLGAAGSGELWRGYDASPISGDEIPVTLLSVSDITGRYTEENPSVANPNPADDTEEIEYDWLVEHNGAAASSIYCFRMVKSDGTPLDGYLLYPELRTAGFTPITTDWRWYVDEENETPLTALSGENVAPIDIANATSVVLRIVTDEIKNVSGNNAKFKLQYSKSNDFTEVFDVVDSTSCEADSIWCYSTGGGINNALIDAALISSADSCVATVGDGCGRHNTSPDLVAGHTHNAGAAAEYSFYVQHAGARINTVYYFRLFDVTNDLSVLASSTYPSLVTAGSALSFSIAGVNAGTIVEGITADVATTPTSIPFGSIPLNTEYEAVYNLNVSTNATEGYQVLMFAKQPLMNSYGDEIAGISATNESPTSWATACPPEVAGCFGYHSGDDVLSGGSARFAPDDSYAALSTSTPEEIMFSSTAIEDSVDIVFRVQVRDLQTAGEYQSEITYLVLPAY